MHELEEASWGVSLRTTNGKVIALGPTLASLELAGRKFARLFGGPKRAPSPTPGRFADDEIPSSQLSWRGPWSVSRLGGRAEGVKHRSEAPAMPRVVRCAPSAASTDRADSRS